MTHMFFAGSAIILAIVITAILFTFWLAITIFRGISRLFLGPGLKQPRRISRQSSPAPESHRCDRVSCQTVNPPEARFCRRCGQRLNDPHPTAAPRAAMF